ncbi:glycosyltransferase family 2 protein [Mesorhizobium sp. KR9-304]|uniref:glycosyltransferase family 2 protein n=1 Tax=Mesorhizobium sp. KR9-304 TaxID=3156614 RepID=UPI0032B3D8A6
MTSLRSGKCCSICRSRRRINHFDRMQEAQALSPGQTPEQPPDTVAILLATRDGAAFLDDQLRSLTGQTHKSIDIWASDDGSTDGTLRILADWRERWTRGTFHLANGPRNGFAENFRSLLANDAIEADYFAFCDQDDLWEAGKLETALAWMRTQDASLPLLFCSRTLTISQAGQAIGKSPLFRRQPSFRNALVQSLAGGNTMVFNRPGRNLLARASRRAGFVSHDWWAYLLVTGTGGVVHYCPEPLVRYRQHAGNLVGANTSWTARLARLKFLLGGGFGRWSDTNLDGLEKNRDLLTPDAAASLELFVRARRSSFFTAMASLRKSGVYRQTPRGTLALWAAVALKLM